MQPILRQVPPWVARFSTTADLHAELGRPYGAHIAAGSRADDGEIEHFRHGYNSSSSRCGSSRLSLTRTRKVTASRAVDDAMIVGERQIHHRPNDDLACSATARSWILCMPRMPDWGALRMGVDMSEP